MARSLAVLIVDDQPAVGTALRLLLELHDLPCRGVSTPEEALRAVRRGGVGVVIQDMNFAAGETSGDEGVALFRRLRGVDPELPILLITAWATVERAVELTREGAADYLRKPWDDARLVAAVRSLLAMRQRHADAREAGPGGEGARKKLEAEGDLCGVVYRSEAFHRCVSLALEVAASGAPVLITGPNGSGKEKIAEIVQANSRRRSAPFLRVNVGAIPEELLDSELFGAEAGAFTGARTRRLGHFESADGGTLFLDEVDALSLAGQVKLLRALESGEIQRLGTSRTVTVDTRVLSATNADLGAAVEQGRFREDLYYRLNVIEVRVPPLADRRDDVLPLARHFLERLSEDRAGPPGLGPEAERALEAHDWPGNVRELRNRIHRATVICQGEIGPVDLDLEERPTSSPRGPSPELGLEERRERERIVRVLERSDGVVTQAAERLGMSRQALYRRMARLGVELERRPRG